MTKTVMSYKALRTSRGKKSKKEKEELHVSSQLTEIENQLKRSFVGTSARRVSNH